MTESILRTPRHRAVTGKGNGPSPAVGEGPSAKVRAKPQPVTLASSTQPERNRTEDHEAVTTFEFESNAHQWLKGTGFELDATADVEPDLSVAEITGGGPCDVQSGEREG